MFILGQIFLFAILLGALALFVWDKWRYDVIAVLIVLAVIYVGILTPEEAFAYVGHPIIVIVASMFVLSQALIRSGVVDLITRRITKVARFPIFSLFLLSLFTAVISAFVNNVGALALVTPIAIHIAKLSNRSVAIFLLPLAFASHLGGYLTLIGTPRNIIVSEFREAATGAPFAFFDFFNVGVGLAVVGLIFLSIVGWRVLPKRKGTAEKELFEIEHYITEVVVSKDSKAQGEYLRDILKNTTPEPSVIALLRAENKILNPSGFEKLEASDVLLLRADPESLESFVEANGLLFAGKRSTEKNVTDADDYAAVETVIPPHSPIIGKTWREIPLRLRFGTNFLAVARYGAPVTDHLDSVRFKPSDVLVLQGRTESVEATLSAFGCLPLVARELSLGRTRKALSVFAIFIGAVILAALNILPLSLVFATAALLVVLLNLISLRQAYEAIEWPILVLIAAMLALGGALTASGGAGTLASFFLYVNQFASPEVILALVLLAAMLIADFVNTTASAVIMAPIAVSISMGLAASPDPFLMAVAIGASSAFLTPTAHESNTVVMGPGGYKFGDYIRLGLPLEILLFITALPLLLKFWPMFPGM